MIIDSFMFFNEFDILEGRLEYLYDVVDRFVIVESNRSHTCKPKPLYFKQNQARYKKYMDKIVHVVYKNMNTSTPNAWIHENAQRNYMLEGLNDCPDDAWVMIGDVDEIPDKKKLVSILEIITNDKQYGTTERFSFQQRMFYYNFNQFNSIWWRGTQLAKNRLVKEMMPQFVRDRRTDKDLLVINDSGWHLTYWGQPETIRYKIENFAHQEYNDEQYKSLDHIQESMKKGKDLFDRSEWGTLVKCDRRSLDDDMLKVFGKYEVNV